MAVSDSLAAQVLAQWALCAGEYSCKIVGFRPDSYPYGSAYRLMPVIMVCT